MTPQEEALWRNRFITLNLTRIGGTLVVLIGLPLALIGLVVSFAGPKWLAQKWRTPPGR